MEDLRCIDARSAFMQLADNVEGVIIEGSGHWLADETPYQVIPKLVSFLHDKWPSGR
jgi:hypothetical protein